MIVARHKLSDVSLPTLRRFAAKAQQAAGLHGELSILLTDSAEIQQLNRDFRGKNKPTDVISFPSDHEELAGDIAISVEVARKQADEIGHDLMTELRVLILHGILHLAGYDHEDDNGEMASEEARLREQLGLQHGLIERAGRKQIPRGLQPARDDKKRGAWLQPRAKKNLGGAGLQPRAKKNPGGAGLQPRIQSRSKKAASAAGAQRKRRTKQ